MLSTVTKLPAAPARFGLKYDKFRDIKPLYPVTVRKTRHGFKSTGLGWEDMPANGGSMHVFRPMQLVAPKQSSAPAWAMNNDLLRELAVRFLENRCQILPAEGATLKERRDTVMQELEALRPHMNNVLTTLCRRYVELKNADPRDTRLCKLANQIENLDTQLMILDKSVGVIISIVYLYWRANMNSVGVAAYLGVKPPHVRTILHRLQSLWEKLQDPNYVPKHVRSFRSQIEDAARRKQRQEERDRLRLARQEELVLRAGKVFGRLTLLGPHVDFIPVEVIAKLEPRSLVAYQRGWQAHEIWVDNKVLQHTGWRKATMRAEPAFESWDCQCACGKQITMTTHKLRQGEATSCGCTT